MEFFKIVLAANLIVIPVALFIFGLVKIIDLGVDKKWPAWTIILIIAEGSCLLVSAAAFAFTFLN